MRDLGIKGRNVKTNKLLSEISYFSCEASFKGAVSNIKEDLLTETQY